MAKFIRRRLFVFLIIVLAYSVFLVNASQNENEPDSSIDYLIKDYDLIPFKDQRADLSYVQDVNENLNPTNEDIFSSCSCKKLSDNKYDFQIIDDSHFTINYTSINMKLNNLTVCEYKIKDTDEKRTYSGISDTKDLVHYSSNCFYNYEGIYQNNVGEFYLCLCQK